MVAPHVPREAMVEVQEGNAELQRRAELARKATVMLNDTLEFLSRQVQQGLVIDFKRPEPGDARLKAFGRPRQALERSLGQGCRCRRPVLRKKRWWRRCGS